MAALVGVVALAGLAAGCGGAGAAGARGASAGEISLRATEFAYAPAQVRVAGPGEIKVTLDNRGVVEHDFTIEGAQGKLLVKPGATGSAIFQVAKAGTYTFACTVPGHKEAGMKGTLTVG
ncbi:MAG: cupredoxin domain-containing protein [Chloroflexi bacterium]|nr:cupredoxin domain-containing protein [Chloroflexota bacterium]